MASPQVENGHLRIANEIADQLAKLNLSKYEWRLLWAILRKTWGWNRKEDKISMSQLEKLTLIERRHISRARRGLIEKNIIVYFGNPESGSYSFQKNYEKWTPLPKEARGVAYLGKGSKTPAKTTILKGLPKEATLPIRVKKGLPKEAMTKDTIRKTLKKETRKKPDSLSPLITSFLKTWGEVYEKRIGAIYSSSFAAEKKLLKDQVFVPLSKDPDLKESKKLLEYLDELIEIFFDTYEKKEFGYDRVDVKRFCYQINDLQKRWTERR